jgi:hypothetical protein
VCHEFSGVLSSWEVLLECVSGASWASEIWEEEEMGVTHAGLASIGATIVGIVDGVACVVFESLSGLGSGAGALIDDMFGAK